MSEDLHRLQLEPTGEIADWYWVTAGELLHDHEPPHEPQDSAKLDAITVSIVRFGWDADCPPLVADGRWLVTGSHRYAAIERLRRFLSEYRGPWGDPDTLEVRKVELAEIYEVEADLDLEEMRKRYGHPIICQDPGYASMIEELPTEVCDRYGLDLH